MFCAESNGTACKKWHYTGTVKEVLKHEKYGVRMDGSDRITYRNRKFLKRFTPATLNVQGHHEPDRTAPTFEIPTSNNPHLTTDITHHVVPNLEVTESHDTARLPFSGKNQPLQKKVADVEEVPEHGPMVPTPVPVERHPPRKKQPLALRRLQDFNNPGLRESGAG